MELDKILHTLYSFAILPQTHTHPDSVMEAQQVKVYLIWDIFRYSTAIQQGRVPPLWVSQ
jgi:hypothetical protein